MYSCELNLYEPLSYNLINYSKYKVQIQYVFIYILTLEDVKSGELSKRVQNWSALDTKQCYDFSKGTLVYYSDGTCIDVKKVCAISFH